MEHKFAIDLDGVDSTLHNETTTASKTNVKDVNEDLTDLAKKRAAFDADDNVRSIENINALNNGIADEPQAFEEDLGSCPMPLRFLVLDMTKCASRSAFSLNLCDMAGRFRQLAQQLGPS